MFKRVFFGKLLAGFFILSLVLSSVGTVKANDTIPDAPILELPSETVLPPNDTDLSIPLEEPTLQIPEEKTDITGPETKEQPVEEDPESQLLSDSSEGATDFFSGLGSRKQMSPKLDSASGNLVFDYGITLPPSRNGFAPDLVLTYDSGNKDNASAFGYGWSINIPYIERLNKTGSDLLYTTNYFKSSLDGELVDFGNGIYKPKIESGNFSRYEFSNNIWTVTDKTGVVYKFGSMPDSRQADPNDPAKIFKWMINESRDSNDNYIKYEYVLDNAQVYPSRIVYTGNGTTDGIFEVGFVTNVRPDPFTSYSTAYLVKTLLRVAEINIKVQGATARSYLLNYVSGDNGYRSMLGSIIEKGVDESGVTITLPATQFTYQKSTVGWDLDETSYVPPFTDPQAGMSVRRDLMTDINGDGYADIFRAYQEWQSWPEQKAVFLGDTNSGWVNNTSLLSPVILFKREVRGGAYNNVYDQGVRLVDLNGDMYSDIIQSKEEPTGTGIYNIYLNDAGNNWIQSSGWNQSIYLDSIDDIQVYPSYILDMNGDGFPDLFRQGDGNFDIQLNRGSSFETVANSWTTATGIHSPTGQIADTNGDGLPDYLFTSYEDNGYTYVNEGYLNQGTGVWEKNDIFKAPMGLVFNSALEDSGARFIDVNGDGLVDQVTDPSRYTGGDRGTYINKGNGWEYAPQWNFPFTESYSINYPSMRTTDLNADGLIDLYYTYYPPSGPKSKNYIHRGVVPDLMNKISYSEGGYSDITYQKTTKYKDAQGNLLNPELPLVLDTVKSISTNDGQGLIFSHHYTYQGGKYYYAGPLDRQFAGFAVITRVDTAGHVIKTYYHQGDGSNSLMGESNDSAAKIGRIYRKETYSSSNVLYAKSLNKWEEVDQGNSSKYIKLSQTIDFAIDSTSPQKAKAVLYTYDDTNGNLLKKEELGEVNATEGGIINDVGSDKIVTDLSYAVDPLGKVIGALSREEVLNQSGIKMRESKFYYDNLAFGSVNKGNLTKEEKWRTGPSYINSHQTFNSYGLITSKTDPRGKVTSYTYDSHNLYPSSITNALDQVTNYTYDYSSGKVKQKVDPNNLVNQYVYDGLDRLVEERQPDLVTPSTLVTKSSYTYTDTPNNVSVKTSSYLDGSNVLESYIYFDGLGRKIQERNEAEGSNYAVKDYVYNNVEQLQKESLPYFASSSAKSSPSSNSALYINYTYDPLSRITAVQNAVGTMTNVYDGWKTTVTSPRGKSRNLYKDAFERLVKVEEFNSGATYTTIYAYNGNHNLIRITDALGNVRNFGYDGLGRRLTAQDLHSASDTTFGLWTFAYDATNNLTSRTDPKGQSVSYAYDGLNRIIREDFQDQPGYEVIYVYDTCTYGIGRLCSVTADVSETKEYDSLGNVRSEIKQIDSVTYQTDYEYDRQGNLLNITNPDNSQVKYVFNNAGQIDAIQRKESIDMGFKPLVDNFNYSPLGKPALIDYANNAETTYTYDAAKMYRLQSIQTLDSSASAVQNTQYTYDPDGNITQLLENANTNAGKTIIYTYDDLNRLASMTLTNAANGQNVSESYSYDAIGNILSKTGQGAYAYGGTEYTNPHAVTAIGSDEYTYDNNGNLVTVSNGLTNTWDYNNRLSQSTIGTTTLTYSYDVNGQRVKYSDGTTSTIYPTRYYNTRGTGYDKHIFAGDTLIATIKGSGISAAPYYVHTDHLMSSSVMTKANGSIAEITDYLPYGEIRLDERTGFYNEQRKFAGHEYDQDTGLSYMNARYYNSDIGRFISQDPVYLAVGSNQKLKEKTQLELYEYLADPQNLNGYSYVKNNPLVAVDPSGEWVQYIIGEKNAVRLGNWAQRQYDNNSVARFAMDHPYAPAIVGTVPLAIYGAGVGASALLSSPTAATILGTGTAALSTQADKVSRVANSTINVTSKGMLHIQKYHSLDSVVTKQQNKSYFYNLKDVPQLLEKASNIPGKLQPHGTYQRVIDAGRTVGWDRNSKSTTSIYTVITDKLGNLMSAFPGK